MPEQDPRQATPRPRPAGTASTGQHSVARTRETSSGPTGTARIPIVRPTPPGPAAPRPGVRQSEGQRPTGQPPVRSRLRTPPAAPPQQPGTQRPAPQPFSQLSPQRPAPRPAPAPAQPSSLLTPVATPQPPAPAQFAPAPQPLRRRRPGRVALAALAVMSLGVLWALPAFAAKALDAPPVAGIATDGVQSLQVGVDAGTGSASADSVSGSLRAAGPSAGGPSAAGPSVASPIEAGSGWMKPVQGHLGDPFGPRPEQPVPGVNQFHRGQDVVATCGAPIHAATSGTVTSATYWGTYGNWILVDRGDGVAVGYAHESRMLVSVGQHVSEGQLIGLVGQTGAATGCHLHLEVHLNSVAVNPVPFFATKGIALG